MPAAGVGTLVDVDGPLGTFIVPEGPAQPRLLFVAGGTGIAPLRAMLDHVLRRQPSRDVSVLYSARRGDEFAFIGELRALAERKRIVLQLPVTRVDSATCAGRRGGNGVTHLHTV